MIRANARSRLRAADLTLVVDLLAGGSSRRHSELEGRLEAEGPDALLDDPRLPELLLGGRSLQEPSSALFVFVMVRRHLLDAGFDDPELADYLAALLLDFGSGDRARRIDDRRAQTHDYLVDIIATVDQSEGDERFLAFVHLGNYALWVAGLFPDRIAASRRRSGGPDVSYYDRLGRQGFAGASACPMADRSGLGSVYRATADCFPSIRGTLNRLSDRVLFPAVRTEDRLLRELCRGTA
jgi:hypothetical protein